MEKLIFQPLKALYGAGLIRRAPVPGGWLVSIEEGTKFPEGEMNTDHGAVKGITFYPDPEHIWDDNSSD